MSDIAPGRPITGRTVLICFVGFFGVVAGVNAIMAWAATSTFGGVETTSAYKAGIAYKNELAAARAQEALGWTVEARLRPRADGNIVDLRVRRADGTAPPGVAAEVRLAHPTDGRRDRAVDMATTGPGEFRGTTEPADGQWDLVIDLFRQDQRVFRSRNRITVQRGG